jgi:hypothetical protein
MYNVSLHTIEVEVEHFLLHTVLAAAKPFIYVIYVYCGNTVLIKNC